MWPPAVAPLPSHWDKCQTYDQLDTGDLSVSDLCYKTASGSVQNCGYMFDSISHLCCQWTDDTSMGLCMAESIIECQGFNPQDQANKYWKWYQVSA